MAKVAVFEEEQIRELEFDEDTNVSLAYLQKDDAAKLSKEVDKIVARTGTDWSVVWNQKLGERVIKGWHNRLVDGHPGLIMPDGSPIPFTPENRDMMMKKCREFSLFVGQNAVDPQIFLDLKKEAGEREEVKNA